MSISKLIIKAYSKENFTGETGEFSASINPANLKITSSVEYEKSQGMGSSNMALRYNISPPRALSFKLLFDNTGIIPDSDKNVKEQLDALQNLVYAFQSSINAPYYVRVIWGVIDFKGKLTSLETSYTMFRSDGAPIRAEVDIVVLEEASAQGLSNAIKKEAQDAAASTGLAVTGAAAAGAIGGAAVTGAAATAAAANATTPEAAAATESELAAASANEATNANSKANAAEGSQAAGDGAADKNNAAAKGAQDPDAKKAEGGTPDANKNAAGAATPANSAIKQTQAGDTLPSVSKNALGDPNLAKKLGSLNGLDSLRNLASGLSLGVPLTLAGLLAMLLAMGKKYGSKGADFLKKKAKAGKDKTVAAAKKGKEKAVAAKDKVKSKL